MPVESLARPEEQSDIAVSLRQYSDGLVDILDGSGLQIMDFPGFFQRSPTADGGVHELTMGITEPYPQRSPRFGAILRNEDTTEQHLVVTEKIKGSDGRYKENIGYALTNVRNNEPQRLMVSKRPLSDAWREVKEGDADYEEHLGRFISLSNYAAGVMASGLSLGAALKTGGQDELDRRLTEAEKELEKFKTDSAKQLGADTKRTGISVDEIDDLHADQTRLLQLIGDLDRKRTPAGERVPRRERVTRDEHKKRAERAKGLLETSYGVRLTKGKATRAVIDRVIADQQNLTDLKSRKETDQSKAEARTDLLAERQAQAARLSSLRDRREELLKSIIG